MPNQPKTRARSVRIDDERMARMVAQAKIEGLNFSETLRNAIDAYLVDPPKSARETAADPQGPDR